MLTKRRIKIKICSFAMKEIQHLECVLKFTDTLLSGASRLWLAPKRSGPMAGASLQDPRPAVERVRRRARGGESKPCPTVRAKGLEEQEKKW